METWPQPLLSARGWLGGRDPAWPGRRQRLEIVLTLTSCGLAEVLTPPCLSRLTLLLRLDANLLASQGNSAGSSELGPSRNPNQDYVQVTGWSPLLTADGSVL